MVDPQAQKHAAADLEPEPRLKYAALSSDALRIFRQQGASCLAVSDKVLALGTLQGGVHLLDYAGTEVRHQACMSLLVDRRSAIGGGG